VRSGAAPPPLLAEVAEAEATGATAAAYEAVRRAIGLPVVNLVYRHLATEPGRLERVWSALEPNLRHVRDAGIATRLVASARPPAVAPIPPAALAAAGVGPGAIAGAEATLAAYSRGNATNLICLTALLRGAAGTGSRAPSAAVAAAPAPALPPMVDPARFAESSKPLLAEMSRAVAGEAEPVIVPSLLRHLAEPPALLALAWADIAAAVTAAGFDRAAGELAAAAEALVPTLPGAVPAIDDGPTRLVLERFLGAIPRALLLGTMLSMSLDRAKGATR
jgi:hypothetical protein